MAVTLHAIVALVLLLFTDATARSQGYPESAIGTLRTTCKQRKEFRPIESLPIANVTSICCRKTCRGGISSFSIQPYAQKGLQSLMPMRR
jgi:hypothetical protein